MLGQAERDERIEYLVSAAEALPLADQSFDLLTVFSAFHWFDRETPSSAEARRVLRPRGWLLIYDSFFSANLHGHVRDFKPWFASTYCQRFPRPPRNSRPLDAPSAKQAGFQLVKHEKYSNVVYFDRGQLIDYLLTQTNVIAAIERGEATLDDVRAYLTTGVSPFFTSSEKQTFDFGGPISYLRRAD